ncbi:hypothetical protein DPMN_119286 [Dreissena polymorpha]|uniref:Uncharacterized protein n=1 Tax=Dreissena polymorpha TaxID=45954 RepID=A0A9D4JMK7_DREPO|nr:hypothetical protein DPMN_119286 [Dreissena polymorpha]
MMMMVLMMMVVMMLMFMVVVMMMMMKMIMMKYIYNHKDVSLALVIPNSTHYDTLPFCEVNCLKHFMCYDNPILIMTILGKDGLTWLVTDPIRDIRFCGKPYRGETFVPIWFSTEPYIPYRVSKTSVSTRYNFPQNRISRIGSVKSRSRADMVFHRTVYPISGQ